MEDFLYYAPTKVVFGKETESKVGELIKEEGAGSVLVEAAAPNGPVCWTEFLQVLTLPGSGMSPWEV